MDKHACATAGGAMNPRLDLHISTNLAIYVAQVIKNHEITVIVDHVPLESQ